MEPRTRARVREPEEELAREVFPKEMSKHKPTIVKINFVSWRVLRRVRCVAASAAGGAACRVRLHPATTACSRSCAAGLSATKCRPRFRHPAARRHPPRRARRAPAPLRDDHLCRVGRRAIDAADLRHRAHRSQHVDGKEPVAQEDQKSVAGADGQCVVACEGEGRFVIT